MALLLSCCAADGTGTEQPAATPGPTPIVVPPPTPSTTPTPKPVSPEVQALMGLNAQTVEERNRREYMTGRLVIPSAAVNVALFSDGEGEDEAQIRQAICDAEDSAAIYSDGIGMVITTLECGITFDGYNDGDGVTDADGVPATFYAEYICYTCGTDWTNVKVVGFNVIDEDLF